MFLGGGMFTSINIYVSISDMGSSNKTDFIVTNETISKAIVLSIFISVTFYLFFISSHKTELSCIDNKCTIVNENIFGKNTQKVVLLENNNDFYCEEYKKNYRKDNISFEDYARSYILRLQGQQIYNYDYKDKCFNELSLINSSIKNNKSYKNEYEHFFINILFKILGTIFAFITFIISISKVSKIHGQVKTKF